MRFKKGPLGLHHDEPSSFCRRKVNYTQYLDRFVTYRRRREHNNKTNKNSFDLVKFYKKKNVSPHCIIKIGATNASDTVDYRGELKKLIRNR